MSSHFSPADAGPTDTRPAGYDAVVVGGGPAGLSAALVLGRSRRSVLLVDAGDGRNQSAQAVHGLLTCDGLQPDALRAVGRDQLARYPAEVLAGDVVEVSGERGDFRITVREHGQGEELRLRARRLVLATGLAEELPDVDGLARRWGEGVLGCPYCHAWEVRGQPIAVLAMGEQDAEFAAQLTQWSDDVLFCSNGADIAGEQRKVLHAMAVKVDTRPVARLEGPGRAADRIVFADGGSAPCRGLFVHVPARQRSDLARRLGCRLLPDDSVAVDEHGKTTVDGVYAVGDMARRPSDPEGMTYVVTAAASGFVAATALNQDLFAESLRERLESAEALV